MYHSTRRSPQLPRRIGCRRSLSPGRRRSTYSPLLNRCLDDSTPFAWYAFLGDPTQTIVDPLKLYSKNTWSLSDAQQLAESNPYTFHKPSDEAVYLLKPGDQVKLIFEFDSDDPEAPGAERMWVDVTEITGQHFGGTLDNDPVHIQDLLCGDPISFSPKHIIQVSIDDPVPNKTDQYLPRCFVTHRVLYDGLGVGYLYREEPDTEDDSGWRILCGDESEAYMDASDSISYVSLGAVLQEDDRIVHLLEAPIGSAFAFDDISRAFIPAGD